MELINAQTILAAILAAARVAPEYRDAAIDAAMPDGLPYGFDDATDWESIACRTYDFPGDRARDAVKNRAQESARAELRALLDVPGFVRIQTSARGSMRIVNTAKRLNEFAATVRTSAKLFGGGLAPVRRAPATVKAWPAASVKLVAELLQDAAPADATALALQKCGASFYDVGAGPWMAYAPMPVDGLADVFASVRSSVTGKYCVIGLASGLAIGATCATRRAAEESARQAVADAGPEKTAAALARAKPCDMDAARAAWFKVHGINAAEDAAAAIAARAADAPDDVAEVSETLTAGPVLDVAADVSAFVASMAAIAGAMQGPADADPAPVLETVAELAGHGSEAGPMAAGHAASAPAAGGPSDAAAFGPRSACDAATIPAGPRSLDSGPSGHAGGPDFGAGNPDSAEFLGSSGGPAGPEPVGISGTHGNSGTRGNSEGNPQPMGIPGGRVFVVDGANYRQSFENSDDAMRAAMGCVYLNPARFGFHSAELSRTGCTAWIYAFSTVQVRAVLADGVADGQAVTWNPARREWVSVATIDATEPAADVAPAAGPQPVEIADYVGTGTYSPEDNKLRLYPFARLDAATYARVKAAGFAWAPKQEVFVAPMWTPGRADLLAELVGEIDDEDGTMRERAAERADRFEDYQGKRAADAERARDAVQAIGARFEFGQPILIGHHSERKARKDAERMENGMRKAVQAWETSQYWEARAAACVRHALYKERPDVRARRIKGLESDLRKAQKENDEAAAAVANWRKLLDLGGLPLKSGGLSSLHDGALHLANGSYISKCFTLAEFPRNPPASQYEGSMGLWSALDGGIINAQQAAEIAIRVHSRGASHRARWIEHYRNRIAYEKAMLADGGGLPADQFDIQPGGTVTHRGRRSVVVRVNRVGGKINSLRVTGQSWMVGIEEVTAYEPPTEAAAAAVAAAVKLAPLVNFEAEGCEHMTAEEWKRRARSSDFYFVRTIKATETTAAYRQRIHSSYASGRKDAPVFITDAPVKAAPAIGAEKPRKPVAVRIAQALGADPGPEPVAKPAPTLRDIVAEVTAPTHAEIREQSERLQAVNDARAEHKADAAPFDAMRAALKGGGVQVVAVPQLFATPAALAARMVELADILPGHRIMEPSAGTGRILDAIAAAVPLDTVDAIEINPRLADMLRARYPKLYAVRPFDFLSFTPNPDQLADRILMNPPFVGGADIKHIKHALQFLKPGGRLVAICAGGPRQVAELRPMVDSMGGTWEPLPADTFKESGTGVNTVLLCVTAPDVARQDPPQPVAKPEPVQPVKIPDVDTLADAIQTASGCTRDEAIKQARFISDPAAPLSYSAWRHGGWYVHNVRYPSGAVGCVSNNYPDKKWRIACDSRDLAPTYESRDAAARAEQAIALSKYLPGQAVTAPAQPVEIGQPEPVAAPAVLLPVENVARSVPVRQYREAADSLDRLARVDYCACVNDGERQNWTSIAARRLEEFAGLTSPRACDFDRERFAGAVAAVRARLDGLAVQPMAKPQAAPPLDSSGRMPASWVIRERETGRAVVETFDAAKAAAVNGAKYEAVAIGDHLAGINAQIRAQQAGGPAPEPVADADQVQPMENGGAGEPVENVSIEAMHAFLAAHYRPDRFGDRDGPTWGARYSWDVARGALDYLALHGHGQISHHESRTGEPVYYDRDLRVFDDAAMDPATATADQVQAWPARHFAAVLEWLEDLNHHGEALLIRALWVGSGTLAGKVRELIREQLAAGYLRPDLAERMAALSDTVRRLERAD